MLARESAADKIEDLTNNLLTQRNFDSFDVRKLFGNIFGDSKITFIYPKNLFVENPEKQIFYVFHGDFISEVKQSMRNYQIDTYPLTIVEMRYQRPENLEREAIRLELQMNNGLMFTLDSKEDNNEPWRRTFTALIQDIYTNLIS